ncbi:MAG: DUF3368 domain-containing protein [Saprospiraceae bacterium]
MEKVIISDTSCLILLDNIGELHLLNKLFGQIIITDEIEKEFNKELPKWFIIQNPLNKNYQKILEASLDKEEASAIALAIENKDSLIIIDDLKGRKYAEELGLKNNGILGILVDAKLNGFIHAVKPFLIKLKSANFRITDILEKGFH